MIRKISDMQKNEKGKAPTNSDLISINFSATGSISKGWTSQDLGKKKGMVDFKRDIAAYYLATRS